MSLSMNTDAYLQARLAQIQAKANQAAQNRAANPVSNQQQNASILTPEDVDCDSAWYGNAYDNKITFDEGVVAVGTGIVTGVVDGFKGMILNEDGSFNPLKAVGSLLLGAACVVCPAIGIGAMAVGGAMAAVNTVKSVGVLMDGSKTELEKRAALEDTGDGVVTVVGCATGIGGAVGAMKSASSAAKIAGSMDDIGKALGALDDVADAAKAVDTVTDAAKAVDTVTDAAKAVDTVTDAAKAVDTVTDAAKAVDKVMDTAKALGKGTDSIVDALKGSGINNADDVIKTLKETLGKAGKAIEDASLDDIAKAMKDTGVSALDQLDDGLKGMEKLRKTLVATAKDAGTSTVHNLKNLKNMGNAAKAKRQEKTAEQTKAKEAYEAAKKSYDDALKASKNGASTDDAIREAQESLEAAQKNLETARRIKKKGNAAHRANRQQRIDSAKAEVDKAREALEAAQKRTSTDDALKALNDATEAYRKVDDSFNRSLNRTAAKTALDDAQKALEAAKRAGKAKGLEGDALTEFVKAQQQAVDAAKANLAGTTRRAYFKQGVSDTIGNLWRNNRGADDLAKIHGDTADAWKAFKDNGALKSMFGKDKKAFTNLLGRLTEEGRAVLNYLYFDDSATIQGAINQFGWDKVNQVTRMIYALGQTQNTSI